VCARMCVVGDKVWMGWLGTGEQGMGDREGSRSRQLTTFPAPTEPSERAADQQKVGQIVDEVGRPLLRVARQAICHCSCLCGAGNVAQRPERRGAGLRRHQRLGAGAANRIVRASSPALHTVGWGWFGVRGWSRGVERNGVATLCCKSTFDGWCGSPQKRARS